MKNIRDKYMKHTICKDSWNNCSAKTNIINKEDKDTKIIRSFAKEIGMYASIEIIYSHISHFH